MEQILPIIICLVTPFLGTTFGSGMVFFMKNKINPKFQKLLLGFASGVMMAASIWSLLLPSMDMAVEQGIIKWLPALVGFLLGIGFLLILDTIIPHLHLNSKKPEGVRSKLKNEIMLVLAVTLHNIPEGMAVGVVLAGAVNGSVGLTMAGAIAEGKSKGKAFLYGMLSGAVEPIAAIATILLTGLVTPILTYLLSFAAGAMIYVVVEELIPESQEGEHSNIGTIGVALGFALMMVLDITFG